MVCIGIVLSGIGCIANAWALEGIPFVAMSSLGVFYFVVHVGCVVDELRRTCYYMPACT
jgi:hypothetical protein